MSHRRSIIVRTLIAGFVGIAAACGGSVAPTAPTMPLGSSAPVSPPSGVATTTWACMTASRTGVFGTAVLDGCPVAMPTTQSPRVSASAVAPGGPANLTASVNGTTVTLIWQPPESGDPATSYVIEAGSVSGQSDLASFDTLTSATSFVASAVPSGRYFVRVRARNAAGLGPASNEVVVMVGPPSAPCAGPPGIPSGLSGAVTGATVTLMWTAP